MEKLIKLLNEWANQMMPGWSEYYSKGDNIYLKFKAPLSGEGKIENEVICSKRYEFIKRLVENDKIDLENFKYNSEYSLKVVSGKSYVDLKANVISETFLLMILSIQDNPIEFLISILK